MTIWCEIRDTETIIVFQISPCVDVLIISTTKLNALLFLGWHEIYTMQKYTRFGPQRRVLVLSRIDHFSFSSDRISSAVLMFLSELWSSLLPTVCEW